MTRIINMTAKGFKSFANKSEFLFSDGFNCIIGPNGSGKSNVLDALCFVLGRTSVKSLRAEKSAALIYNGGKTKQPAKEGMVEITFSNDDNVFPIDAPTVTVTRAVKQTGVGVYKINGEKVTRAQIQELLMNARIDPDGHNIILQGDIIHMIDMSNNERRQVIEDVAGISVYEERKQKALKELEKVDQKLNDTEIILTERETHIKELKSERDQAIKYKEVVDKINTAKALRVRASIRERTTKIDVAQKALDEAREKIKAINEKNAELTEKINNSKKEIAKINEEIEQKGEKEQVQMQKLIESLKIEYTENKGKIDSLNNEIKRINERRAELKADFNSVQTKIGDFDKNKSMLVSSRDAANKSLAEIEAKITKFKEKNNMEDTQKFDEEIDAIDKELEEISKQIEEARAKQQNLFREKDQLEFKLESLDEQMYKLKEMSKEAQDQINDLKNKKEQLKKVTVDLSQLLSEDSSMASQISNAKKKSDFAKDELSKLEAKQKTAAMAIAGNMAAKEIMELKKTNKIAGIIGGVSELGNVKKEFAAALEVAAANRIKGIVVEDDNVGAKCINYLKTNRLGTASFLPLNKIKAPKMPDVSDLLKQDGVYGKCIDLIKHDLRYRKVFEYVFGATIVVKNVAVARSIGIGKVRMVTLDGDLIEPSGAMVGGYRKGSVVGAFKDEDVSSKMDQYEKELGESEQLIGALTRRKQENEEKITRHRTLKAELEGDVLKLSKILKIEETDTGDLKDNRKKFKDRIAEIDTELRGMTNELGMKNKEAVNLKIQRQQLKNKVNDLRNPLKLAELNTLEAKKQSTREELIKLESEIKSLEIQIKDIIGPEEEKIGKILKQLDKEDETFSADIKKYQDSNTKLETEIAEKEKKQKEFYAKFKAAFDTRSKLSDSVKTYENRITNNEADVKIATNKININNLNMAQFKAELEGFNKEFELYKDLTLPESDKNESQLKIDIDRWEKRIQEMGNVNMKALEIYEKVEEEYTKLKDKREKLVVEKEDILIMVNEIETNKKEIFMKTFNEVNEKFKRIFVTLSTKGEAFLSLENPDTPFEGGMTMKVKLNSNKHMDIRSLSGGEKTMTALALLFAIQEYDPASFYVLDEVDAALDKKNSEKLAELVNQYTGYAQYIIISHNDGVISAADTLFGISMDEHGITKVTSLKV